MTTQQTSGTELAAAEPAGYWTGAAYEAIISFIRARQAELGFTQPQFWLLRNLSRNDISPDGRAMTIPELQQAMSSYLRAEDDLEAEAEILLERGWLTKDAQGRLQITESGEEARVDLKGHAPAIGARIHEGIDDADYRITLKVLKKMIQNTTGTAA